MINSGLIGGHYPMGFGAGAFRAHISDNITIGRRNLLSLTLEHNPPLTCRDGLSTFQYDGHYGLSFRCGSSLECGC
jgi:hypothetical protein